MPVQTTKSLRCTEKQPASSAFWKARNYSSNKLVEDVVVVAVVFGLNCYIAALGFFLQARATQKNKTELKCIEAECANLTKKLREISDCLYACQKKVCCCGSCPMPSKTSWLQRNTLLLLLTLNDLEMALGQSIAFGVLALMVCVCVFCFL
jgi:hypothetical protein